MRARTFAMSSFIPVLILTLASSILPVELSTVGGALTPFHIASASADAPSAPTFTPPSFNSLTSSVTTAAERSAFLDRLHKEIIEGNLAKPLNAKNEELWESAYWGMELCLDRTPLTLESIRHALNSSSERSDSFTRATLEAAWTLYPDVLTKEVEGVAKQTKNTKNFAMAVHYVLHSQPKRSPEFYKLSLKKFPNQEHDPLLAQLRLNLEKSFTERLNSRPPLEDLLKQPFPGNVSVVFSFQRRDRNYPGLAAVRKPDGSFVRRPDGSLFCIPQLARSMPNYPGYLTNGNTPQGIFSNQGFAESDNSFEGPVPNLQIALPHEVSVAKYFHDPSRASEPWSSNLYKNLLPASWQNYVPIYEAYAAGEIGRGEIISHGTTIDPEYYKGTTYYPNTPSMGCLTALDLWSPKDGKCVYSDQLALVDVCSDLHAAGCFLVVVELDNQARPVNVYDVLPHILRAEAAPKP